jgi:hypothetical protein
MLFGAGNMLVRIGRGRSTADDGRCRHVSSAQAICRYRDLRQDSISGISYLRFARRIITV